MSNDSRGTSTQSIKNSTERDSKESKEINGYTIDIKTK